MYASNVSVPLVGNVTWVVRSASNRPLSPQHVPGADAGAPAAAGRLRQAEARGGRQVRQAQGAHVSVALAAP